MSSTSRNLPADIGLALRDALETARINLVKVTQEDTRKHLAGEIDEVERWLKGELAHGPSVGGPRPAISGNQPAWQTAHEIGQLLHTASMAVKVAEAYLVENAVRRQLDLPSIDDLRPALSASYMTNKQLDQLREISKRYAMSAPHG